MSSLLCGINLCLVFTFGTTMLNHAMTMRFRPFFRFVRCVIPFMLAINAHNSSEMFQHKHNKALHTDNLQLRLQAPYAYGSG
jgi:hypothetical protein